jgi:acyl-coenzyme A synthetase/AMP-(fatty) acid ligase
LNLLPHKLAEFIRDHELTKWFSVPSVLNYMAKFDVVKANDFPSLRRILWCGEAFPTPSLRYWMQKLPRVTFTNLYGPTETTIASSYYTVPVCPPHDKVEIPIGRPCPDEELFVLDEKMCSVAPGETGDLYICGVGLSTGYWKNPDTTAKVFLKNPLKPEANDMIYKTGDLAKVDEEGLIYYVGRCDAQIKSRGYRIELGEIEAGLHSFEELRESAVVAIPTGGFESHQICCAYVAQEGKEVTPLFLRKRLSTLLPPYMIPSRFREFSQLPRTANGKIDCRFLREEFAHNETETRHRGYRGSLSADVR